MTDGSWQNIFLPEIAKRSTGISQLENQEISGVSGFLFSTRPRDDDSTWS